MPRECHNLPRADESNACEGRSAPRGRGAREACDAAIPRPLKFRRDLAQPLARHRSSRATGHAIVGVIVRRAAKNWPTFSALPAGSREPSPELGYVRRVLGDEGRGNGNNT